MKQKPEDNTTYVLSLDPYKLAIKPLREEDLKTNHPKTYIYNEEGESITLVINDENATLVINNQAGLMTYRLEHIEPKKGVSYDRKRNTN